MALIERRLLRTEVRRWVMERVFAGDMEPGSQIVERELAAHLGVSRTPLREALLQLECEGFLSAEPGKGYTVRELIDSEASDLFDLGTLLEPLALRMAGIPDKQTLARLEAVNEERAALIDDLENRALMIELDDRWHRLLVSGCPNDQLLDIVRLVRNRMYRYVCFFSTKRENLESAIAEHRRILALLRSGDLDEAVEALREHWEVGRAIVLDATTASG